MTMFDFLYFIGCGYAFLLSLKLVKWEKCKKDDLIAELLISGFISFFSWGFVLFVKNEKKN